MLSLYSIWFVCASHNLPDSLMAETVQCFHWCCLFFFSVFQLGYKQDEADWSRDMRGKQMRSSVELANWVMVFPRQCEQGAREMVNLLYQVGPPMGMRIREPRM